jgi:N,N-dimethylformamidase
VTSPGLDAKPIVGYTDPLCVAPGEPLDVMVTTTADSFEASVVRLRHGDPAPGGPGLRYEDVESEIAGLHPGSDQPLRLGSHVTVEHSPRLEPDAGITIQAWMLPTTPARGLQGVVTKWCERRRVGYGLFLEADGSVSLRLDDAVHRCSAPLRPFEWAFVSASWDRASGAVSVRQTPLARVPGDPAAHSLSATTTHPPSPSGVPLVLAGHVHPDGPSGDFNGKIESPRLFDRSLAPPELDRLAAGAPVDDVASPIASWDLVSDADSDVVQDRAGADHHGIAFNHPTRGVTGHAWTGEETAFFRAPSQYNAAFFHDDDLEDAGWEPAFTFVPPETTRSGVYAIRTRTEAAEDWIPFFVRPPRGRPSAPIAFLAPTISYLAYANDHSAADVHTHTAAFDIAEHYQAEDRYAIEVPVCGLYDHHPDGAGVCYSSWRRPLVSMRPHYHLPVARSAHQLSADLHVVDWLEEKRLAHDVVTDHDLHDEGLELLRPYRVVLTGTHPEYWTFAMLDALDAYLEQGGRLVYLGGNGFYWVTSVSPARPHLIEVRRGRRGTGSWRSEPGEDHHSTTGELGGLWRDRGRAPQRIAGVGMAAQGFGRAIGYTREPDSYEDDVAWIFEGVDGHEIPAGGLVLDGPAGFEIDRVDHRLGTPPNARLLATARGFSDDYQHVVEEVTTSDSRQGGSVSPLVRADMVYVAREGDGATFATGSIAWSGALSLDGYDSAVSRITENVVRGFATTAHGDTPGAP